MRPGRPRAVALLAGAAMVLGACSVPSQQDAEAPAAASAPRTTDARSPSPAPRTTEAARSASGRAAAPAPRSAAARVDAALAGLSRAERVGQLFLVGVPLDDIDAGDAVVREGVGGVFLAGRSQMAARDLAGVTARWQRRAPGPDLWIAVDQEGGAVQTLSGPGFAELPAAREQGRLPQRRLARLADGLGRALAAAGVNLNLAPVADVVPRGTERQNAPIGYYGRQYGSTAEEVVRAAGTVVEGMDRHGVTAVLKHFPGLGRVRENTDTSGDVVDRTTGRRDEQVRAFAELLDTRARPFVMVSSAVYRRIDPARPAAWSPRVLTDLLRDGLGFDGVTVSDDVGAAAAVQDVAPGERAVRFLAAGGTVVLTVDPALLPAMREAVLDRARDDRRFRARVDDAVRTALLAKAHAGLLTG